MGVTFEDVEKELRARKARRESGAKDGPGVGQSFMRGVMLSPVFKAPVADEEATRPAPAPIAPPSSRMSQYDYDRQRRAAFGPAPNDTGIAAPTNAFERIAHGVGEAAPFVAAGGVVAPFFAPAAPVAAMAGEAALGTFGTTVAEAIREGGGDTGSQIAGEVIATAAAPLAAPWKVAKRAGQAAARSQGVDAITAASEFATKYNVEPETAIRAAGELKRKIARGVNDPEKYVDKVRENLGRDIEAFGEVTPTLAQSAGEYGGQNIASMELNWAKRDQDFAADTLGRRLDVAENLEADFSATRPDGAVGGATDDFAASRIAMVDEERAAWRRVREAGESIPSLDVSGIKRAADELRGGTKASRQYLPGELKVIDEFGAREDLLEIQDLRSELLETQRAASNPLASPAERRAAAKVKPLLDAIDEALESLPEEGGRLYAEARAITRRNKGLFDGDSKAVRAMTQLSDGSRIVARIRNAGDPVAEVRRLREIASRQENGIENLRSMFFDDLFGEALGDKTVRQMESAMNTPTRRAMYREVFGDEGLSTVEELIRRQRVARTGKAGTTAAAASTGTGQAAIDQLFSIASDASNPGWALSKRVASALGDKALDRKELIHLMRLATQDIRLAKALLDIPTPRQEPVWRIVLEQGVKRARNEAAKAGGRNLRRLEGEGGE